MSASSKKKLRKEQNAAQMTEKQRQQQAEAKKLKTYTIVFVTSMILVVAIALFAVGYRSVNQSGIFQRNTIAATIEGNDINSVEMTYFYIDAINNMYNQWYSQYQTNTDSYVKMLYGLDTSKPLSGQIADEETGETWAEYFIDMALEDAKGCYALYNKAVADKYELSEEDREELASTLKMNDDMATLYGYKSVDDYLAARYGYGSNEESYNKYLELTMYAYAYSRDYYDELEYTDAQLRDHEKNHYNDYSSYSFASYYLTYTSFLEGGTKDESGKTTYSDAEKDAARAKLKEVAESLAKATSVEELDKLIGALDINKDSKTPVTSTKNERKLLENINDTIAGWLKQDGRKIGDIGAAASTTTNKNAEGVEVTTTDGYYVLALQKIDENKSFMSDVRHLLVKFEGGTKDSAGNTKYSDAEKAAAKKEAEGYLETWKNGEKADEAAFIELVKKHSDDSSKDTGGLFEDINPDSSYVTNFLNWSIDAERKAGDTDVIETEYGYHVMYFVGHSEQTYRDFMITTDLKDAAYDEWYNAIVDAATVTEGDFTYIDTDHVISYNT